MMFLPFVLMLLFWGGILGFGGYLALRLLRAYERRSGLPRESSDLLFRIEQLEQQLEQQGEELRRVAEGQRFTERLLTERSGGDAGQRPTS